MSILLRRKSNTSLVTSSASLNKETKTHTDRDNYNLILRFVEFIGGEFYLPEEYWYGMKIWEEDYSDIDPEDDEYETSEYFSDAYDYQVWGFIVKKGNLFGIIRDIDRYSGLSVKDTPKVFGQVYKWDGDNAVDNNRVYQEPEPIRMIADYIRSLNVIK